MTTFNNEWDSGPVVVAQEVDVIGPLGDEIRLFLNGDQPEIDLIGADGTHTTILYNSATKIFQIVGLGHTNAEGHTVHPVIEFSYAGTSSAIFASWVNVGSGAAEGGGILIQDDLVTLAVNGVNFNRLELDGNSQTPKTFVGTALQLDTSWTTLTPINGWATPAGFPPTRYRMDALGCVQFEGALSGGTNVQFFTLPVGYRPLIPAGTQVQLPVGAISAAAGNVCRVTASDAGVMTIVGQGALGDRFDLTNVRFSAQL